MLEFYYDFIDKYLDHQNFQYIEIDTDPAYIALAGQNLEDLVKPELKKQFFEEWNKWLPVEACAIHKKEFVDTKVTGHEWQPESCCMQQKKFDQRTPGLFKVEWKGDGMVGLCSKTYFGWGDKNKCSTKGISKTQNTIDKDNFLKVLTTKQSAGRVNIGQCSVYLPTATRCPELPVPEEESLGRWNYNSTIISLNVDIFKNVIYFNL